ncbi:hypothetical protein [Micromonospora sp. KC213]|uniref:hypothetical protein n=1 Tax=Micromonospora sp. KC213 TaxID=2530378 RepID=UPI0010461FBA|nr:hypothetical protein [Micromonospora sp. KC213]TDC41532.1 hypothetical protein E1166_11295 [Micromonospora sp. KC213]
MLKRLRSFLAVVVTASAALLVLGSPAQAAQTAYLDRIQWLSASPKDSMDKSCQTKSITLASGRYAWGYAKGSENIWLRDITLDAGTYTWQACLDPRNGIYYFTSVLDGPSDPATINTFTSFEADGYWRWGSYLDPYF